MRILKNQTILQRQSENYIKGELSNVASVLQTPQVMTEYYSVDQDASTVLPGFKNNEDIISPSSTIVYNFIDNLPMSGIDNLVTQSQFDEELGFDEDLQSSGIILPNTIFPKPYDCFIIKGSSVTALYIVTTISPVTVRSNPFVEINFRLFSRDPKVITQLQRQVKENYETTVTAIGLDKSLVVKKSSLFTIKHHVEQYLELADLYSVLFYDYKKAAFIFDGLPVPTTVGTKPSEIRECFIDMTLWKFMFDEGIILYDDVITYANNNFQKTIDRIYSDCPDVYLDEHYYRRSILYRIFSKEMKNDFSEYRYPLAYKADSRVAKFQGRNIIYLESYNSEPDCSNELFKNYNLWCDDFIYHIKNNILYEVIPKEERICNGCEIHCGNKRPYPFNPSLRNVIINWFNNKDIDWETIEIEDLKTVENYYLIPLVLAFYKEYIFNLQK